VGLCDVCPRRRIGDAMPPKRGRAAAVAEDETAQEFRRHKSAVNEAMNEFLCPITFSLPVDPVTAEDGKVYERSAIEEWLKQQLKSPVTNLKMGTKLLPALQVKNMIRAMVTSGALTGDKVDAWKLKLEEEEEVAEMLRKAEAGDGRAMHILGLWYERGQKGLAKDLAKAFEWYEKSHEAGNATGTAGLATCYLVGKGVPKCQSRANTLMSQGAERGSKNACCNLGNAYADGLWGFPKDEKMARRYYSMMASASIEDCKDAGKEEAATWLREHPARSSARCERNR
jgi:TPR repeat protein